MRSQGATLVPLALVSLLVVAVAPFLGVVTIGFSDLTDAGSTEYVIFYSIRLPRVLTAGAIGGLLACSGAVFQALFRNPLASPFTLGISSGAAFGASLAFVFGWFGRDLLFGAPTTCAFLGALLTVAVVHLIAARSRWNLERALLTGVVVNFFFGSLIIFLQYLSDVSNLLSITRWMMGDIAIVNLRISAGLAVFALFFAGAVMRYAARLDLILLGDELAETRGVALRSLRRSLFLLVSMSIGVAVALCGPIGFVGVVVPHICRVVYGVEHKLLLPTSFMLGAAGLVLCDCFGRMLLPPVEIPVGIITALIGGPFFVFLLLRRSAS